MISEAFVLPEDVGIFPASELPADLLPKEPTTRDEYVVTRSNSRTPSRLIDVEGAELIRSFREARTIVDAIISFSKPRGLDPQRVLGEAFPLLRELIAASFLVPEGAKTGQRISPTLATGQEFYGWVVEQTVQLLEDTEVYRACDHRGNTAALKVARPGYESALRPAFEHEASILSRIGGGFAPRLLGVGEANGRPFLVTQWCDGTPILPFARRIAHEGSHAADARLLALCVRVLRTYAALHASGIVHGDVHPNNLLVAQDNGDKLHVLDFGHARVLGDAGPLGSPRRGGAAFYFDPELAKAMLGGMPPPAADPISEQYCLGVLVRELIAGRPYLDFAIERQRVLQQIVEDRPLPFIRQGVAPWPAVERALARALEKSPEQRFSSVAEFAGALSGAQRSDSRVASARPPELLDSVLRRVGMGGCAYDALLRDESLCSVNMGAAGVAYALYRIATVREDSRLLSLADLWIQRAERRAGEEAAFYPKELGLTVAAVGRASLFHSPSGLACVDALIGIALGDTRRGDEAIRRFVARSSLDTERLDVTGGMAGTLLGCAALVAALSEGAAASDAITAYGDRLDGDIRSALVSLPPIGSHSQLNFGIAHGWGGVLFALLRWREARKLRGVDHVLQTYLSALAERGETIERGMRWRWSANGAAVEHMPGWCNGSAGFVHLWNVADRAFEDDAYASLAASAGIYAFEAPAEIGDLCCGAGGRAYAMLDLYRQTGERVWLERAHGLASSAVALVGKWALVRDTLYKGDVGVALLVSDLERPELSSMPLFDKEP
jgi:eukaryotic-like serine/threonine-protein kinase